MGLLDRCPLTRQWVWPDTLAVMVRISGSWTVLLAWKDNGTDKLPLLITGKRKPSLLKNVMKLSAECVANRKAWVTHRTPLLTIWMTEMPKWIPKTKISLLYGPVCCSLAGQTLRKNGKVVNFFLQNYYQCPTTWLENNHFIQTLFLQATFKKKQFLRLITCYVMM